jgi:hypothetical protein
MSTNSTSMPVQIINGVYTEVPAITTSGGAADAQKIPALNAQGVLDATIVNSVVASAGSADAGKLPALSASGHLDPSVLPTGVGPEVTSFVASETITAGAWVNVWNNNNVFNVRNADGSVAGKDVTGFVLSGGAAGATLNVYTEGINTAVVGMVAGPVYLQKSPGVGGPLPIRGVGAVHQRIGTALSATAVAMRVAPPCTLAA